MWLLTNVLDPQALTPKMMVRFYQKRWGVEMSHPDYRSSDSLYLGGVAA
jgi:hypothetical protein